MVTNVLSSEQVQAMSGSPVSSQPVGASTDEESLLSGANRSFRQALERVERSERFVDRAVRRVSRGDDLSSGELLALQANVYRASQQAELVSRAVDRLSDTVREITQLRV